jgi:uncharacterized MnhB-related membrane protein
VNDVLNLGLAALILGLAVWTIVAREAYAAVVGFIAYGLLLTLVWVQLHGIDVALTEAAIGGGLTGALLIAAAGRLRGTEAPARAERPGVATRWLAAVVSVAVAGALDALMLQENAPRVVILDVPLLAEAPEFLDLVDAVLVISTHEDARLDRLAARGMPQDEAERRIACQASDAERRDIADYIIENDGSEVSFRAALASFWDEEVAPRVA